MRTGFVLCTIHAFGYIPELQRMGPVIPACNFPAGVIFNLVKRGYTVYEHNPIDQKVKVHLTLENFNDVNKFEGQIHTEPVSPVVDKKVETPSNAEIIAEAAMAAEVHSVEEAVEEPPVTVEPEVVAETEEAPVETEAAPQLSRKQRKALARQKAMEEKAAQEATE